MLNKELYWSIILEPGLVQSGVWEVVDGRVEMVSVSLPVAWQNDEDLVGACDTSLSSTVSRLPDDSKEPTKTVFGVPSSWVEGGTIKAVYLEKIKNICSALSLAPSGFVVLAEAIAHYFKFKEQAPQSAVIIGVGSDNLELSVFQLGNLVGSISVARSVSIANDVVEGLSHFSSVEHLPSRFILYDGKEGELEAAKNELMTADWEKPEIKVKLLHPPKVESLAVDEKVLATSLAGAGELVDIDVEAIQNISEPSPNDFGFKIEGSNETTPLVAQFQPQPQPIPQQVVQPQVQSAPRFKFPVVKLPTLPKFNFRPKFSGGIIKTGGIFLGVLLVVGFLLWWFVPKAEVTIYVSPQRFEEKRTIIVNDGGSLSVSDGVIPGEKIEVHEEGEKTISTTGTKLVGERARGTVKIQNGTAFPITLASGAFITNLTANLRFTLDQSASVSQLSSPSSPGTASVGVTAENIGSEYNLAKDESFKVGNYPKAEVDAVSESDFSGGSSREISAVSQDDRDRLESELGTELADKGKEEISTLLSEDQVLIPESVVSATDSASYSNKVGDEASNLKLNLKVGISGMVVKRAGLVEYAREVLKESTPEGYVLRDEQIDFDFRAGDDEGNYEVAIQANYLPEIDLAGITKQITGKYPILVKEYLTTIPGYSRAEVEIKPSLPGKLGTLPRVTKNITLIIVPDD